MINCYGVDCSGWRMLRKGVTVDSLGYVPMFLIDNRPAREQFEERYVSGWRPIHNFNLENDCLVYPGDPPLRPLAELQRENGERIVMYDHAFFAIFQPDGTFEVARMD